MILSLITMGISAQKPQLISDETLVIQTAIEELNLSVTDSDGVLNQFITEHQIKGNYTFNLTIREKGEVATVFAVSDLNNDIKIQNLLKDKLKSFRFNFRMPKGVLYKFQYTFNL